MLCLTLMRSTIGALTCEEFARRDPSASILRRDPAAHSDALLAMRCRIRPKAICSRAFI